MTCLIAVCIPTFRRNTLLDRCLAAVGNVTAPRGCTLEVIVADNDPDGSARPVCETHAPSLPWPLRHVVHAERGLASVRNRLLEEAGGSGAQWIAFVDDDETPAPDWLEQHMESLRRHSAVVSSGPVIQPATPGSAERLRHSRRKTGEAPRHVACNNVVFSISLVRHQALRFDRRFDFSGGEDFDFFDQSRHLGNAHVWTAAAVVFEAVTPERAGWRYLFHRHFQGAGASVLRYRKYHGKARAWLHFGARSLGKSLAAVLSLCLAPIRGRRVLRKAVKCSANATGFLWALLGGRPRR